MSATFIFAAKMPPPPPPLEHVADHIATAGFSAAEQVYYMHSSFCVWFKGLVSPDYGEPGYEVSRLFKALGNLGMRFYRNSGN